MQIKAIETLGALATHNHEVFMSSKDPSTLDTLVALLEIDETNPLIKVSVANILLRLAESEEAKETILTFLKLFDRLLDLIDHLDNVTMEKVQKAASCTIARLAHAFNNKKRIAEHPYALRRIVGLLAKDISPKLQFQGARILSIVSVTRRETKKVLVETSGALDRLLSLMCNDGGNVNRTVQQQAAVCINNLTMPRNNQLTKATILRVSDSLMSLLSSNCVSLGVKQYVATSWANLAAVGGLENKLIMLRMKGALPNMMNLLKGEVSAVVQEQIVFALGNLAIEHKNKREIASVPSILRQLVNLMSPASSISVQKQAASLLALLATAHRNKCLVASTPGLLEYSVRMMATDNYILQLQAARLLGNLTVYNSHSSGIKEGRRTILRFEGVLEGFVKLLGMNDQNVQKQAARSIGHLANVKLTGLGHENKEIIAAFPGALEVLLMLLADSMELRIRFEAARTLVDIIIRNESNRLKVAEALGAVEALVHSLECMSYPNLQGQAAWALVHLAISSQNRKTIAAAGAIERLQILSRDPQVSSMVHRPAARALTLINHEEGGSFHLQTGQAHIGRGRALLELNMHKEAVQDFEAATQIFQRGHQGSDREKLSIKQRAVLCKYHCFAKAMLKDYQGALRDADVSVKLEPKNFQRWHERGALKAMIGQDLEGALEDLNKGNHLVTSDDSDNSDDSAAIGEYHRLKHRGFVKMKSGDETGANADASCAQRMNIRRGPAVDGALGAANLLELPVAYLDFQLL